MSGWKVSVVAVGLLAAACTGDPDPEAAARTPGAVPATTVSPTASPPSYSPPPPPRVSATPPEPDPADLPAGVTEFGAVCSGSTFPGAAAYRGRGPHRIVLDVTARDDAGTALDDGIEESAAELPAAWETVDVTAVQLVACARVVGARRLRTCSYSSALGPAVAGGTPVIRASLYDRTFIVDVREIRTGRKVGSTTRVRSGANACADGIRPPSGSSTAPHQYGTLTGAQLRALLAGRVEGTVG